MVGKCLYAIVLGGIILSTTTCSLALGTAPEDMIEHEMEPFIPADATLLYKQIFTDMGATGACRATYTDQWYGTSDSFKSVKSSFEGQIAQGDWAIWPEDVVEVWRKETPEGLYSIFLEDHTSGVGAEQSNYTIPDEVLQKMRNYPTVYLLGLGFMRASEVERCFGR